MSKFDDLPEARRKGLERMEEVYGFEMTDGTGDFFGYTADHLFADVWNRPGLTDRDREPLRFTLKLKPTFITSSGKRISPPGYSKVEKEFTPAQALDAVSRPDAGMPPPPPPDPGVVSVNESNAAIGLPAPSLENAKRPILASAGSAAGRPISGRSGGGGTGLTRW